MADDSSMHPSHPATLLRAQRGSLGAKLRMAMDEEEARIAAERAAAAAPSPAPPAS